MFLLFIIGCGGSKSIIEKENITVKEKEFNIIKEGFNDSLNAVKTTDTLVLFNKVIEYDTVFEAKYYPVYKTLKVKTKPDTIKITTIDTIQKYIYNKTEIKKESIFEKIGEFTFIITLITTITLIIFLIYKKL